MKKIIIRCLLLIMLLPFILIGCQNNTKDPNNTEDPNIKQEEKEEALSMFNSLIEQALTDKNFYFAIKELYLPFGDTRTIEGIEFDGNKICTFYFSENMINYYSKTIECVDDKFYIYSLEEDEESSERRYYKDNYEGIDFFQYVNAFVYIIKNNVEWGEMEDGSSYVKRGLNGRITDWGDFEFIAPELTSGISNEFHLIVDHAMEEYGFKLRFDSENHEGPIDIMFWRIGHISLEIPTEFVDRT